MSSLAILACKRSEIVSDLMLGGGTVPWRPGKSSRHRASPGSYLLGAFVIGYVRFHAKGPLYMEVIFLQGKQEHDQHEEGIHHKEGKYRLISQFL